MFSKKRIKKVLIVSTALKIVVTVAGMIFIQATGIVLPNPLRGVETRIAQMFNDDSDVNPQMLAALSAGKAGRGPMRHHVM